MPEPFDPLAFTLELIASRHSVSPKKLVDPGPTDIPAMPAFGAVVAAASR